VAARPVVCMGWFFLVAREGVGCDGLGKGRLLEQPASAE
jgi:hypothetical protein